MKFRDMLRMSLSSLWKRKVRTFLTVLGVVIGTASIVVMISLGLGLSRASMAEIEKYGGITTVTVTEQDSYTVDSSITGASSKSQTVEHLDDDLVENILQLDHVKDAYPVLDTDALAISGGFQANIQLRGVAADKMQNLQLDLGRGSLPQPGEGQLSVVYGNMVLGDFYNDKTGEGYWYNGTLPDIDLMTDTILYVFDVDRYYNAVWGGTDDKGQAVTMPKKYVVDTAGVVAGGMEDYNSNSSYVFCDLEQLKTLLRKEFRGSVIPGQPTTANGKAYKDIYYTSVIVNVDNMDYVQQVQNEINDMGYQATSNAEWVASMQGQYKYIQLALGGIGAVSLFVAAIGIANTMMMSIYERTKEIGIMKVLGCDMRNIQSMFLMEAGYIGLIGGAVGLGLSYGLSAVINSVIKTVDLGVDEAVSASVGLSYIPWWLAVISIVFAVLVGMIAGFFPSLRAMKLSPLAAIRTE